MNLFENILAVVKTAVSEINPAWPLDRITVEEPKDSSHGEMATNAAMVLAKDAGMAPRALAEQIAEKLRAHQNIVSVELAGPGFINLKLAPDLWRALVPEILRRGVKFGAGNIGQNQKFSVEYVSANPTGPLLASHARGAVLGDALSNLLQFVGYDVTREYYLNDYGNQVNVLARSVYLRYREALGEQIEIPKDCYPGEYLVPVGAALAARDGKTWLDKPETEWLPVFREFAIAQMMQLIKQDLAQLNIVQDHVISERQLVENGAVQAAFDTLQSAGHIYHGVLDAPKGELPDDWEPREQWLFRATDFGDDVDRPMKKSDGSWTYFASDVACHYDKFQRGFHLMENVFGADHSGYVKRIVAATRAVTAGNGSVDIKIVQIVRLLENGKVVRLSKRAGNLVFLSDVIERVGKDVVRLIMLTRDPKSPLDFDFAKVIEQSSDNPVFYVQYAHARICSVLRHAGDAMPDKKISDEVLAIAEFNLLDSAAEISMLRRLAEWPRIVAAAALAREPHRIAFYLQDVAAELHSLWTAGKDDATLRFILPDQPQKTVARLALLRAVALVIASGLGIIGVEPVQQM